MNPSLSGNTSQTGPARAVSQPRVSSALVAQEAPVAHLGRRAFLASAAGAGVACKKTTDFVGFAFVANEEGKAIAAVDLTALVVVRHIALDAGPTQLVNHTSRRTVYALTPSTGTVHEISVGKLQRERWTALGGQALDMKLAPRGDSLWVLLKEPRQLVEVRLETMDAGRRIALPEEPVDFDLSLEEPRALVSFGASGKVGMARLDQGSVETIDCGAAVGMARFRKDGRQWIAAHRNEKLISFYDTNSSRVVVRLPLAMRPDHFAFKADGGQLFVTGEGTDGVAIVFPYWTEVAETVLAGRAPAAMATSPMVPNTPECLFVTNPVSGQLTVINIESRKVMAVAQVGAEPTQVITTPNNLFALVLNQKSGDMAVLHIASTSKKRKAPAALITMIPVGSKPVSAVVQMV